MNVSLNIQRTLVIDVPVAKSALLLDDIEATFGRFPKLKRMRKLGERRYVMEMDTIGSRMAKIAHNVRYGAAYAVDHRAGRLSWSPIAGEGNAQLAGELQVSAHSPIQTRLQLAVSGELRDVPVPLMYRLLAPPFIQGKFTHMVDRFLEETQAALQA